MARRKIAITIENETLIHLDQLIKEKVFPNRSRVIQEALKEKFNKMERVRLARECSKLDPEFEKAMAEEGLGRDRSEWPEY